MSELFSLNNYSLSLKSGNKSQKVLSNIEIHIDDGEIVGLIGESGSGKSMLWKSALGLADSEHWEIDGSVVFNEKELPFNDDIKMEMLRGKDISVILQDPMNAFDQVFTIKHHFLETVFAHENKTKTEVLKKAISLMKQLYIRDPEKTLNMYPFQCSGGMLQRIMIAIALMMDSKLIIADEPTTSVDVTVQREIVAKLKEVNKNLGTGILFISHDLEIMENLADRVYVMYAGYLIEEFPVEGLYLRKVCHPYTRNLLNSRPAYTKAPLLTMPGNPPTLSERQSGCPFAPRCGYVISACKTYDMKNINIHREHNVRCFRWKDVI